METANIINLIVIVMTDEQKEEEEEAMTASSTQRRHHGTGGTAGRPRSGTTWYDNRRQFYSAYQSDYGLQY